MGNCLLTKLKGNVDNNELSVYGKLNLKVIKDTEKANVQSFDVGSLSFDVVVTSVGGSYLSETEAGATASPVNSITVPHGSYKILYLLNDDYLITISDKYNNTANSQFVISLTSAPSIRFDLSEASYVDLKTLGATGEGIHGNIDVFKNKPSLFTVNLPSCPNISGNTEFFKDYSYPAFVNFLVNNSPNVQGKLEDLGGCIAIKNIQTLFSGMNGSIDEFVSRQVDAGRGSVPMSSPVVGNGMLYMFSFGGRYYKVGGQAFLCWDSKTKITMGLGGNTYSSCTSIYAKNPTEQEVSTWRSAGKNVITV